MKRLSLVFILALTACGGATGTGSILIPTAPHKAAPDATPPAIYYTALGDSITANNPGDTPQNAPWYPDVIALSLGATLTDLAIPGEFSGQVNFLDNAGTLIDRPGVLASEVPFIPANTTLITLYIGTNDFYFEGNIGILPDYSNAMEVAAGVADEYAVHIPQIIAGIKSAAPNSRIVLIDMINPAWRAINRSEPLPAREASAYIVDSFKSTLYLTGLSVVDLLCDSQMYNEANYSGPYNPHPNATGHARISQDVLAVLAASPTPANTSACQYEDP